MSFDDLAEELCRTLRRSVHNGEVTERGFARRVGLSQSHLHNLLSGTRVLTLKTADRILRGLRLEVEDLIAGAGTASASGKNDDRAPLAATIRPARSLSPGRSRGPLSPSGSN